MTTIALCALPVCAAAIALILRAPLPQRLAAVLGVLWLVGLTNAFNLLDNMDGLASTLAMIAGIYFAIDAVTIHKSHTALAIALALAAACAGFIPYNLRPGRPAAIFMGDSG